MAEPRNSAYKKFTPVSGPKDGMNPIIFLHAMLYTKEVWTDGEVNIPQLVANGTQRVVYTYDAICHGEKRAVEKFSLEALVEDLQELMKELGISKAILVGHSMGGKTAIEVALSDKEKVEKVFIVDMYVKAIPKHLLQLGIDFLTFCASAVHELPEDIKVGGITSLSVTPPLYKKLEALIEGKLAPVEVDAKMKSYIKSHFQYAIVELKYDVKYNLAVICNALKDLIEKDEPSEKKIYTGPAFFLYGTKSPYEVGKEEENIKQYFEKAVMVPFDGAPHHIFATKPQLFVDTIINRINEPSQ